MHKPVILNLLCETHLHYLLPSASNSFNYCVLEIKEHLFLRAQKRKGIQIGQKSVTDVRCTMSAIM